MIEQVDIRTKYEELYKRYSNQYIDDYDKFVCARVIEYFLNTTQSTADSIADLVKYAFESKDKTIPAKPQVESDIAKCPCSNSSSNDGMSISDTAVLS